MSQLDNFRKSLGLPNPEEVKGQPVEGEKKNSGTGKHAISLRDETYVKCKCLVFWMGQQNPAGRNTIDVLISKALDLFMEEHLDAKAFYNRNH